MIFCLPNCSLDSARQKNFEQLAAKCFLLERKTVARQLLRNRARALAHVAGREVFQCRTDDPHQIVSLMPIKFCVLDGDDRVDEIARQLIGTAPSPCSRRRFGRISCPFDRESRSLIPFVRACSDQMFGPGLSSRRQELKCKPQRQRPTPQRSPRGCKIAASNTRADESDSPAEV